MSVEDFFGFLCCGGVALVALVIAFLTIFVFMTPRMLRVALGVPVRSVLAEVEAIDGVVKRRLVIAAIQRSDAPVGVCIVTRSPMSIRGVGAHLRPEQARQLATWLREAAR